MSRHCSTDKHERNATQYDSVPYKNAFIRLIGRFSGVSMEDEFCICDTIMYMIMPNLRERICYLIESGCSDETIIKFIESSLQEN